jgi:hypothetical protein
MTYRNLDPTRAEVRLLKLEAGFQSSQLQCELQQVSLLTAPKPEYETISYCWGGSKATETILLNGKPHQAAISAVTVLRRFRLPDADRTLWIDALCINQDDTLEKGYQVAAMHEVYSAAQRNLIWLGEDGGTADAAIKSLEDVLRHAREMTEEYKTFLPKVIDDSGQSIISHRKVDLGPNSNALLAIYSKPWYDSNNLARFCKCHLLTPLRFAVRFRRLWVTFTAPQLLQ